MLARVERGGNAWFYAFLPQQSPTCGRMGDPQCTVYTLDPMHVAGPAKPALRPVPKPRWPTWQDQLGPRRPDRVALALEKTAQPAGEPGPRFTTPTYAFEAHGRTATVPGFQPLRATR
jgi:hypothetical protein